MVDFSKMKNLKSSSSHYDDSAMMAAKKENFRAKVSMQQFMNHNGAIFKAFARKGITISDVTDGDILLEPTSAANSLVKLVASGLEEKGVEIGNRETSFFRSEAASWVAERWEKNENYDIEGASKEIVKVVIDTMSKEGKSFDYDPYKDDSISNDASLMMSAASVTGRLMKQVEIYDFRVGRNAVLQKLLDAVIETSVSVASEMLPKGASKNDVANLTQTVSRNFTIIIEGIYERKAREVTSQLNGKPTKDKVDWLNNNLPLDDVIKEFKDWAYCFVGFAIATCNKMSPKQSPNEQLTNKN